MNEEERQVAYETAKAIKDTYEHELMAKANVVGVGVGLRRRGGELTDNVALVVMVSHKLPPGQLDPDDMIPSMLNGVPVDVQEVGQIRAQ